MQTTARKLITITALSGLATAAAAQPGTNTLSVLHERGYFGPPQPGHIMRVTEANLEVYVDPTLADWVRDCVLQAGTFWAGVANLPTISLADNPADADITVLPEPADEILPNGSKMPKRVAAVAIPRTRGLEILGGTIFLNVSDFRFVRSCLLEDPWIGSWLGLKQHMGVTLAHELGHLYGFGHGPGLCKNVMEPSVNLRGLAKISPCRCLLKAGKYDQEVAQFLYGPPRGAEQRGRGR